MSKKLSQAEIDALVASLMSGDAPADEGASDEASGEEGTAEATPEESPSQAESAKAVAETPALDAPSDPSPAPAQPAPQPVVEDPAPTAGLTGELIPFEQIQDLGPVTQPEVDAAMAAYRNQVSGKAPASAEMSPPAAEQEREAPAVEPEPAARAVEPEPAAPAAAAVMTPPTPSAPATLPPSKAEYAVSQAQAAQQTRKALSMAALSSVMMDIELTVTVELGKARLSLSDVLALGPGSVITLDHKANTPIDVMVNQLPLMKAEVLAIAEKYGVRITQSNLNVKAAS